MAILYRTANESFSSRNVAITTVELLATINDTLESRGALLKRRTYKYLPGVRSMADKSLLDQAAVQTAVRCNALSWPFLRLLPVAKN